MSRGGGRTAEVVPVRHTLQWVSTSVCGCQAGGSEVSESDSESLGYLLSVGAQGTACVSNFITTGIDTYI